MSAQVSQPLENAFLYKNLLFFINNQALHHEAMSTYLNTTFQYLPKENDGRTTVVNGKELYYLGLTDTVFIFYSIDCKYIESTVSLMNSISEYITLIIKKRYSTPALANFISIKLCCYLPSDKNVPFGFVRQSENNSSDLFGVPLLSSKLTLYTKAFEFDEKYDLKTMTFDHLIDYSDMIQKFVQKKASTQHSTFTSNPMQMSVFAPTPVPTPSPSSLSTQHVNQQPTFIGFQNPFDQYQYGKRSI